MIKEINYNQLPRFLCVNKPLNINMYYFEEVTLKSLNDRFKYTKDFSNASMFGNIQMKCACDIK